MTVLCEYEKCGKEIKQSEGFYSYGQKLYHTKCYREMQAPKRKPRKKKS